jgi:hypothetical protein
MPVVCSPLSSVSLSSHTPHWKSSTPLSVLCLSCARTSRCLLLLGVRSVRFRFRECAIPDSRASDIAGRNHTSAVDQRTKKEDHDFVRMGGEGTNEMQWSTVRRDRARASPSTLDLNGLSSSLRTCGALTRLLFSSRIVHRRPRIPSIACTRLRPHPAGPYRSSHRSPHRRRSGVSSETRSTIARMGNNASTQQLTVEQKRKLAWAMPAYCIEQVSEERREWRMIGRSREE